MFRISSVHHQERFVEAVCGNTRTTRHVQPLRSCKKNLVGLHIYYKMMHGPYNVQLMTSRVINMESKALSKRVISICKSMRKRKLIRFRGGWTECGRKISARTKNQKKAVHKVAMHCRDGGILVRADSSFICACDAAKSVNFERIDKPQSMHNIRVFLKFRLKRLSRIFGHNEQYGISKIWNPQTSEYETNDVKHDTTLDSYLVFLVSILILYCLLRLCPWNILHFKVLRQNVCLCFFSPAQILQCKNERKSC